LRRRPLVDVFVLVLLALMLATGLPEWIPGVRTAQRWVDPLADVTGVQQSNWQLFAPEPDSMNTWVEAVVTYSDGSTRTIASPDWQRRTLLEKFVQGRWPKILDYVRRDDWKGLWEPYALWVARTAPPPDGARPVEVKLIRHWWNVPAPSQLAADHARFGAVIPAREDFPRKFTFYVWRAR
jgi:hypothetical protein